MPVIAVTGGVATGKSAFVDALREYVQVVISADAIARDVLSQTGECYDDVLDHFGREIQLPSGNIDRRKLGSIVFADPDKRRELERIVHPVVLKEMRRRILDARAASPDAIIVVEVPLLYELGLENEYDIVVVVACSEELQVNRLQVREHLDREQALMRMAAQIPLGLKVQMADRVIWNEGQAEDLGIEARRLVQDVQKRKL